MLISQNSDLINLINQSIKNDLNSRNPVHVRYFKTTTYVNLISTILHKHRYELFIKTCTNIVSVLLSSVLQTSVQKIWLKHLLAKYQSFLSQGKVLRCTYYVKSLDSAKKPQKVVESLMCIVTKQGYIRCCQTKCSSMPSSALQNRTQRHSRRRMDNSYYTSIERSGRIVGSIEHLPIQYLIYFKISSGKNDILYMTYI